MSTQKITDYLIACGRMSGWDICADCGVTPADVELAQQLGAIQRCAPEPGGVGPWYRVALASLCDPYEIGDLEYPY